MQTDKLQFIKRRKEARIHSFQFLYHLQFPQFTKKREQLIQDAKSREFNVHEVSQFFAPEKLSELHPDSLQYAHIIIEGTLKYIDEIESMIKKYSTNWPLHKISKVDLTILLQAIFEMIYKNDIPKKVVINESIELAKIFSEKNSSGFINGILDKVAKSLESNENEM